MTHSVKDMVSNGKKVTFQFYRKGNLFYKTECGFVFPVPTSDTGEGAFLPEDKAMLFMRWIRKEVEAQNAIADKTIEQERLAK